MLAGSLLCRRGAGGLRGSPVPAPDREQPHHTRRPSHASPTWTPRSFELASFQGFAHTHKGKRTEILKERDKKKKMNQMVKESGGNNRTKKISTRVRPAQARGREHSAGKARAFGVPRERVPQVGYPENARREGCWGGVASPAQVDRLYRGKAGARWGRLQPAWPSLTWGPSGGRWPSLQPHPHWPPSLPSGEGPRVETSKGR